MIFSKQQIGYLITITLFSMIISYLYIDKNISLYFIEHANTYKNFGKDMSKIGESHWYIGIALLGIFYYKFIKKDELFKQRFLFLLYLNIFSGLISIILKPIFGRIRPWDFESGENQYGFLFFQHPNFTFIENLTYQVKMLNYDPTHYFSFPSGHSITTTVIFIYMSLMFPKKIKFWIPIALLGLSGRILSNDHFLSDVLGGMLIGILSAYYIYYLMKDKIKK